MGEYGYVRVSSTEQNEGRHLVAMEELNFPLVFLSRGTFLRQEKAP